MQNDSYDSKMEREIGELSEAVGRETNAAASEKRKIPTRPMPTLEEITGQKIFDVHPPVQSIKKKEFVSQIVEKISSRQVQDFSNNMPSYVLADKILSQQRKVAALKRKSPLENNEQPFSRPEPVRISSMPAAPASPQQKIVAEIVAKEIMALSAAR